jgi:uncharacterized cupredoxin-like copper-binding protein
MTRRITLIAAVATVASVLVAAVAIGQSAPNAVTLTAKSGTEFKINQYVKDTSRWTPGTVTIASGGTLTVKTAGDPAPHSFSVVKASQVPKTQAAIGACKICETLGKKHGANPESEAPPKKPVLDVGAKGIDQAGDSIVLQPKKSAKLTVSAKAGTTLSFICAIHPWMQGKLAVK